MRTSGLYHFFSTLTAADAEAETTGAAETTALAAGAPPTPAEGTSAATLSAAAGRASLVEGAGAPPSDAQPATSAIMAKIDVLLISIISCETVFKCVQFQA